MHRQIAAETDAFRKKRKELLKPQLLTQDPFGFSHSYCCALEELIQKCIENEQTTAVLACGSFGRRELSPYSDINLIILGKDPRRLNEATHEYYDLLSSAGLSAHILAINAAEDYNFLFFHPKNLTQIFEIRFICGNHLLWEDWQTKVISGLSAESKQFELLYKIISNSDERHEKYGKAPGLVEPHIKLTAGGLRDLHVIEWLITIQQKEHFGLTPETTKADLFNSIMVNKGVISSSYAEQMLKAYSFVLSVRHALHYAAGRRADRLTIELQNKAAVLFGYEKNGYKTLMDKFYNAASTISRVSRSYIKYVQGYSSRSLPDALIEELDGGYRIRGEVLELDTDTQITPETLFQGFYYRGKRRILFDMPLRYRFLEFIEQKPEEHDPGAVYYFRKILRLPSETGSVIRSLSEIGALELLFPEFTECRGFFTPSFRHGYTVDEHTIRCIETVEKFEEAEILPGRILMNLSDREPLYLALLFHDLAKPYGNDGHEIMGASIAETIMSRLGFEDDITEMVAYLIKNHYLMPEFAYLSNPYNPLAAEQLLPHIPSVTHLELLFILSYADLLSASPFIKTSWKEERLTALYRRTRALLLNTDEPEPEDTGKPATDFYDKLRDTVSEEELAAGKMLGNKPFVAGDAGTTVAFVTHSQANSLEISVITFDKPFLLSNLCAIFILNGFSIQGIRAFTGRNAIVYDRFILQRAKDQQVDDEIINILKNEIINFLNGFLSLTDEMNNQYMRPSLLDTFRQFRRPKPVIEFTPMDAVTRLKITTVNKQALIYFISSRLGHINFEIAQASVSVNDQEFTGEFYIKQRMGNRITSNFYPVIESELSKIIQEIPS